MNASFPCPWTRPACALTPRMLALALAFGGATAGCDASKGDAAAGAVEDTDAETSMDSADPSSPADGDTSQGEASWPGCQADCAHAVECGFADSCDGWCDALDEVDPGCAEALDAWSMCASSVPCEDEESQTCEAESNAVSSACQPTDDERTTCEAYCQQHDGCGALDGETREGCIEGCGFTLATSGAECRTAASELFDCVAVLGCTDLDAYIAGELETCLAEQERLYGCSG